VGAPLCVFEGELGAAKPKRFEGVQVQRLGDRRQRQRQREDHRRDEGQSPRRSAGPLLMRLR
jgi:hypothetical protein